MLEEIGHKIDRYFNGDVDSAGDEGEIFSRLVGGQRLSPAILAQLKAEDDQSIITVSGKSVTIENQNFNGDANDNTINGTAGNDIIRPGSGKDKIDGGLGNDILRIDNANDTVNTTISYGNANSGTITNGSNAGTTFQNIEEVYFTTGSGNDVINISAAKIGSSIYAGAGNDKITGGAGKHKIYGGADNDSLTIYNFADTANTTISYTSVDSGSITGGSNAGTTFQNIEEVYFTTGSGNDVINISAAKIGSSIYAGAGNDKITGGAGNDDIGAGTGNDTIDGGGGNSDYLTIDNGSNTDTDTTINYTNVNSGTISGGSNNGTTFKNIEGGDFSTGAGNDVINISAATIGSSINAGAGNDKITGGAGNDVLDGGSGNDFASYYYSTAAVTVNLATNTNNQGDTLTSIERLQGSAIANSTLTGDGNNNYLYSYGGNDVLTGGAGIDILSAGAGADTLNGDAGNDYLYAGIGNDTLTGGADNDIYLIDADVDTGTDKIIEVAVTGGIDTLDFRATAGKGININLNLLTTANQVVATGVNLTIPVASIENVYGGALGDSLTGNNLNNTILGGGGDDHINGGGGSDYLYGGAGNDLLGGDVGSNYFSGGIGNDTLNGGGDSDVYAINADVDTGTDTINEVALSPGTDTLDFRATTGKSIDVDLSITASQAVATGGVNLVIPVVSIENVYGGALADDLIGNSLNNTILGGAGDDYLNGGGGNDYLSGGAGDDDLAGGADSDVYAINADVDTGTDTIHEVAVTGGIDTLDFRATATKAINVNLSNIMSQKVSKNINLVIPIVSIENVYGGLLADGLTGNSLNNTILGGAGDDLINGGRGNDYLSGEANDDELGGEAGNDYLSGGGGNDNFYFYGAAITGKATVASLLGKDTISDFSKVAGNQDKILLSKTAFTKITTAPGALAAADFVSFGNDALALASDSTAAIFYSKDTGNVFYNQDGNIAGVGTNGGIFATLTTKPLLLAATDFSVGS